MYLTLGLAYDIHFTNSFMASHGIEAYHLCDKEAKRFKY